MANNIDILGNARYVQAQGALGQQQGEQRLTRRLAGQVIGGDPQAAAQLAALDPAAAKTAQGFGDDQVLRLEGLVNFMDQAEKSGNPQAAQQAWQAHGAPYVRQFANGTEPTQNWAEAKPLLENVRAKIAMVKASRQGTTEVPTGFRELDLKLQAAGYKPGTPEYENAARVAVGTVGRAATGGFGFEVVKGADGRERMGRTNPRTGQFEIYDETTGQFVPVGGAGQLNAGQPAPQRAPGEVPFSIDPTLPPQVQAAIRANEGGAAAIPDGGTLPVGYMPSQAAQAPAGGAPSSLTVSRSPEEQAAATEAATQAARTAALAEQEGIKADAATRQAVDIERGKLGVATQAAADKRGREAVQTLDIIDEAERILPGATSGLAESIGARGLGAVGVSTPGAQATARLKLLAAKLIANVPRFEGPQSNIDVKFYREAAGDLANDQLPVQTRLAALQTLRDLNEKAAQQNAGRTQIGGDGAPVPGTIEDGFRFKGGNPADPNSWEQI